MSSEKSESRRFFWDDDGSVRAVFKHVPMIDTAKDSRKRKAQDSEAELIALNSPVRTVVFPSPQKMQKLEQTLIEKEEQQLDSREAVEEEKDNEESQGGPAHNGEPQVHLRGVSPRPIGIMRDVS